MPVTTIDRYRTSGSAVSLDVSAHGALTAVSHVTLDRLTLAAGQITNLAIGYGDTLVGKWLSICIMAVAADTSVVSVSYVLKSEDGGKLCRSATRQPEGSDVIAFKFAVLFD